MNGDVTSMAYTASLLLQLLIIHPIISLMKLVAGNAGQSPALMETAIPLHPFFCTQVQLMATGTSLIAYLYGFSSPAESDERWKSYAPPGPR